jgi:hypothetical protein
MRHATYVVPRPPPRFAPEWIGRVLASAAEVRGPPPWRLGENSPSARSPVALARLNWPILNWRRVSTCDGHMTQHNGLVWSMGENTWTHKSAQNTHGFSRPAKILQNSCRPFRGHFVALRTLLAAYVAGWDAAFLTAWRRAGGRGPSHGPVSSRKGTPASTGRMQRSGWCAPVPLRTAPCVIHRVRGGGALICAASVSSATCSLYGPRASREVSLGRRPPPRPHHRITRERARRPRRGRMSVWDNSSALDRPCPSATITSGAPARSQRPVESGRGSKNMHGPLLSGVSRSPRLLGQPRATTPPCI